MFVFSPRVRQRDLALLCRRLSTALEAGIDVRRVFAREATSHMPRDMRRQLEQLSQQVSLGQSLSDALTGTGAYFPRLFHEMVRVGEQTGHLAEVFGQLAEHFEHQERMRKEFLASIAWPMIELSMALSVIGLVIWISGFFEGKRDLRDQPMDLLGFGLQGTPGLLKYLAILGVIGLGFVTLFQATRRGWLWARPLQRGVLWVPKLGNALRTLALARLAWAMHLTCGAGMDLLRALPLSLRTMRNVTFTEHAGAVTEAVRRGDTVTGALQATGVFPATFLDALDVGERSGRLPETMELVSRQYQDEARRALAIITRLAGFAVWVAVAGLIIFVIFRLFSFYLAQINALL